MTSCWTLSPVDLCDDYKAGIVFIVVPGGHEYSYRSVNII